MSSQEDFLEFMKTKMEADKKEKEADAKFGEPIKSNLRKFKDAFVSFMVLTVQHAEFTRIDREKPLNDSELIFCVLRTFDTFQSASTKSDFVAEVIVEYRKVESTGNAYTPTTPTSNGAPVVV